MLHRLPWAALVNVGVWTLMLAGGPALGLTILPFLPTMPL